MTHGGHTIIVSQDIHKRLTEDVSLTGMRLGKSFGVAKKSLPPPLTKSKCKFFNHVVSATPKPPQRFKKLSPDGSL